MSTAIYRKYRSQSFADLHGQELIKEILIEAIKSGRIAHAYLFSGPRGTGKTSTARLLAKALNDKNFHTLGDIDTESEISRKIEQGTFIDLIEIDAASNRGIEEIRELREKVKFLPVEGTYKVYIIDEAHMLTREAFNALLKTLEEPPKHVIFILATTEHHKIPVTITSRLQKFNFKLASAEDVKKKLAVVAKGEDIEIEEAALEMIYKQSGGSFRDAESILDKVISSTGAKKITVEEVYIALDLVGEDILNELLKTISDKDLTASLDIVDKLEQSGKDVGLLISQLAEYLRTEIIAEAKSGSVSGYKSSLLTTIIEWQIKLKNYNDPKLLLQMLLIKLCAGEEVKQEARKPVEVASKQVKILSEVTKTEQATVEKDERWNMILNWVKKISMQAWMSLRISELTVSDSAVEIKLKHKSSLTQLEKSDIYQKLSEQVKKAYGCEVVNFVVGEAEQDSNIPASLPVGESNRNIVESIL
jgi:DNA polymerase-3 subunit gamma/tau